MTISLAPYVDAPQRLADYSFGQAAQYALRRFGSCSLLLRWRSDC
jgi:hypothetical protein